MGKNTATITRAINPGKYRLQLSRKGTVLQNTSQETSLTLSFYRQNRSIKSLDDISLPSLVVLTGRNGSGKSHLLEAISIGSIRTNITNEPRRDIGIFNWNTIVPTSSGSYSIGDWSAAVEATIKHIENIREAALTNTRNQLEANGGDASLLDSIPSIAIIAKMIDNGEARPEEISALAAFKSSIHQYKNSFISNNRDQKLISRGALLSIWHKDPMILGFGDRSTIRDQLENNKENSLDIFQQAFSKIFVEYLRKWQENKLLSASGMISLSEDEFIDRHHIPPWDFVNSILEKSRLPFRIDRPKPEKINESYEPKLSKNDSSEMRFEDLSSGEKVLMSFAFCVYNAFGEDATFPKILLLDEVDAPLHPEMVDVVLKVIKETLVEENGIKVILSTHKPTTVALAPEESIYEIVDSKEINKISREKAVSILTVGVPTMAFTSDLRQQVFTEAEVDATALSMFYDIYKSELPSDRSLVFIPTGRKTLRGDRDSGCSRVIDLVSKLTDSGVKTVSGIIDWDGKNKATSSVFVLCDNTRHSIENLVLDPLILVSLIVRDFRPVSISCHLIGDNETYLDLMNWNSARWQDAVSKLSIILFGDNYDKVKVKYKNGMELDIPKEALHMRGHEFRRKLDQHWTGIMMKHPGDNLISYICRVILREIKGIAPLEIYSTVEKLAECR